MHRIASAAVALVGPSAIVVGALTAGATHQPVALRGSSTAAFTGRALVASLAPATAGPVRAVHTTRARTQQPHVHARRRTVVRNAAAARRTTSHRATSPALMPDGPTSWGALNAAIARIPTYHSGDARWVIKNTGWWGTADWQNGLIYISPPVPDSKLYDLAVPEWS